MTASSNLLQRLMPRRLYIRLAILGGILLALVIGAHTAYTVVQQSSIETMALETRAQALANQIAISAASLLVTRRYSEIEELLVRTAIFPDILRAQVTDTEGRMLSDVVRPNGEEARAVFEFKSLPLPQKKSLEYGDVELVVWQPIDAGTSIGWVRLVYSLNHVIELRRRIVYDGAWAALIAVTASLLLFAAFLRRPMRSVAEATRFAGQLDELRGAPFPVERGSEEIEQLGEALNRVSLRLAEQELAITAANRRLEAILRHAIDGIVTVDVKGKVESANPAAERMFGFGVGGLNGHLFTELVADFSPSDEGDPMNEAVRIEFETNGVRRDGSVFPVLIGLQQMDLEGRCLYVGLLRDITEQKRLESMKEKFVESVSHELRTPLTALHGSLELLATDNIEGLHGKAKDLVALAYKNSGRLVRLVNDILDFEDVQAGRAPFDVRPIPIVPLLHEVIATQQAFAVERNIKIVLDTPPLNAMALVDPRWIKQALTALMTRAVRSSPSGEIISIGVYRAEGRLRVTVTDHGSPIPKEARPYLFQKFVQLETDARYHEGADVGLGLAKAIVEHLGGMIDFTSGPNTATTFFVDLPEIENDPIHF